VRPETAAICHALALDPLGLIASGSLLIAAHPDSAAGVLAALREAGHEAARIGHMTQAADAWMTTSEGARLSLPVFARDELARFLEGAAPRNGRM
jgi:hydrogenase expression/formation protein HypE